MPLTIGDKIKVILKRRNMTLAELAEKTDQSRQNMSNKMSRDNFNENDLKKISTALNCEYAVTFKLKDTGEEI